MAVIWCRRNHPNGRLFSDAHGHNIHAAACVASDCQFRSRCSEFSSLPGAEQAEAIREAESHGHKVYVRQLPLLEAR